MIVEALDKLGVGPAILVVHSLAGAIGARMALDYPSRVAGLVMLAPVTHPWRGGVGWYNMLVTTPVIGPCWPIPSCCRSVVLAAARCAPGVPAADHAG